jgi:hypothetical protein
MLEFFCMPFHSWFPVSLSCIPLVWDIPDSVIEPGSTLLDPNSTSQRILCNNDYIFKLVITSFRFVQMEVAEIK